MTGEHPSFQSETSTFTPEEWIRYNTEYDPDFDPEEFEFHQKRFTDKASKYNSSIFNKILHPNSHLEPKEVLTKKPYAQMLI